jgi:hypothetical protein
MLRTIISMSESQQQEQFLRYEFDRADAGKALRHRWDSFVSALDEAIPVHRLVEEPPRIIEAAMASLSDGSYKEI